ncbi:hypothetical protein ACP70R_033710 [Stipagrostis hirtigluma subsp. patula]
MQDQLTTMAQSNAELRLEQQSQRSELSSLRGYQNEEVASLVKQQVEQQMAGFFARRNPVTNPFFAAFDKYQAVLDNNYYKLLGLNLGLFFSDNQLRVNATLNASVTSFASNETDWKQKLVAAMVKMGNIGVLTGTQGEIRLNCSIVNNRSAAAAGIQTARYARATAFIYEVATS